MKAQERQGQGGFVVVLALIALMAMSFFLLTGVATTTTTMKVSGNYTKTVDSFNLAEVGLAKARPIVEVTDYDVLLSTYTQHDLPLIAKTSFNNGTYEVLVKDNDNGDSDPYNDDGDSNPYADNDSIIVVRSIGRNQAGGTVEIEAHLQKFVPSAPDPFPGAPGGGPGAALMCGTASDVDTGGTSKIQGHDYVLPSLPCPNTPSCAGVDCSLPASIVPGGPCEAQCGVGVTCPSGYSVQSEETLSATGPGYVSDKVPAFRGNVTDTQCDEWKSLRDQLAELDDSSPHVEVLSGNGTSAVLNDCTDPKVFIINTSEPTFKFSGNAQMCGIVVVASNTAVEATGNVVLIGLVLIMGESAQLNFSASMGTPRIFGQIIVESTSVDKPKELYTKGTAEINFSTEGLGFANEAMNNALNGGGGGGGGGLITMAWKETY
jgi:hypothetical protein